MLYKLENSKDTLKINCILKTSSESFRQIQIKKGFMAKSTLAGKWPAIGEKVLLVVNPQNRVSLFAFYKNGDYRFWDPNSIPFANSVFEIIKESPFKPLPECESQNDKSGFWICEDGCLAVAIDIRERG